MILEILMLICYEYDNRYYCLYYKKFVEYGLMLDHMGIETVDSDDDYCLSIAT